jgi:hypothetical protein
LRQQSIHIHLATTRYNPQSYKPRQERFDFDKAKKAVMDGRLEEGFSIPVKIRL